MSEDVKIYHVETQEDYDDLMIELEQKGYKWMSGDKPTTKAHYWDEQRENTAIVLDGLDEHHITRGSISWCKGFYSNAPVIKHKAKGVKQMEKVVVPQFVADWYEERKGKYTIYGLIGELNKSNEKDNEKMYIWRCNCQGRHINNFSNAQEVFAKMHLYGYEVEEEKKYYWRKKKEHCLEFEYQHSSHYINFDTDDSKVFLDNREESNPFLITKFTKSEIIDLVGEEDFNKLERIEIDDVQ